MATIKAGTYRFNDVLTAPSGEIVQEVNISIAPNIVFDENAMTCVPDYTTVLSCSSLLSVEEDGGLVVSVTQVVDGVENLYPIYVAQFTNPWDALYESFTMWGVSVSEDLKGYGQTITLPTNQEVSTEFAEWFSANAAPVVEGVQISGVWKFKDELTGNFGYLSQPVTFEYNYKYVVSQDEVAEYNAFLDEVAASDGISVDLSDVIATTYNVKMICTWMGGTEVESFGYQHSEAVTTPHSVGLSMFLPINNSNGGHDTTFYYNGWYKEEVKTIDFGTEPQTVSAEFYNWLTANADPIIPAATITHNGEVIAELNAGQTATLKCAGMKMATDVVVSVADNVDGGTCDKPHIIEVDELPETGEDGAIYSVPSFSALALCVDGNIIEDLAKENGMIAKHYTAVTLPETGEQNDICYVESENEVYLYMDDWYAASVLLPMFGFSVEMKGVINSISEITEDGYYVVMGGKALSVFKEGRLRTLLIKGELEYSSNNPGVCYADGVEPYYDSKIIIPSISPDGLTVNSIGADAFNGCAALTAIVIPDSVETIGRSAFENCYALNSLTMGSGVKTIADNAFARCYALETVTIPDSVQTIGDNAFNSCYALYYVTIGSGVKTIGVNAFRYCSDLYTIVFNGTMAQWETINKDIAWHEGTAAVEVTCTDGKVAL